MLVLLVVLASIVLVLESGTYLLRAYELRAHGPREGAHGVAARLVAGAEELAAALVCLVLWPLAYLPVGPRGGDATGRPVLLIHGWGMNRTSMWRLEQRLRRAGRPVAIAEYPSTAADMDTRVVALAVEFRGLLESSGADRIDVVAHSLGGVLLRAVAGIENAEGMLGRHFGNVVTLGSPHQGTPLACLFDHPSVISLRPRSRYLLRLADAEASLPGDHFVSLASTFDSIVFPSDASYLPEAFNVRIDLVGHTALLFSERVWDLVRENLDYRAAGDDAP